MMNPCFSVNLNKLSYIEQLSILLQELRTTGTCPYIQEIAQGRQPELTLLECSILQFLGGYLSTAYVNKCLHSGSLPLQGIVRNPSWAHCTNTRISDPAFSALADQVLCLAARNQLPRSVPTVRFSMDDPRRWKLSQPFQEDAERIRRKAQEDAQAMLAQARAEAEQMKQEARAEAERLTQNALAEAAEYRSAQLRQAEADAQALAAQKGPELAQKYLQDYKESLRQGWEDETDLLAELQAHQKLDSLKRDLCDGTDTLKHSLRDHMAQAMDQLKAMQTEVFDTIHKFQGDLYRLELQPLADCYSQLCMVSRRSRLLWQALAGADDSQAEALRRLMVSLDLLTRTMEKAMARLGLRVFTPQAGEAFDDVLHSPSDFIGDPHGKVIAKAISPGVMQGSPEDPEAKVLLPATVELTEKEV